MWKIKNGILHDNDKPVYGIGLSYYASYRKDKVPVPEDGDRIGEMKKDIPRMKECGFNIVRFAALGEVKRVDGEIIADTEFIDALMSEADKADIATMLRLQGYTMNLSGWEDCYMLDQNGNQLDRDIWLNFVQNSLHHKGILKDNIEGTEHLAKHYVKYNNLVSFQTYNEPHYPSEQIYDYHPEAIKAFRKYLVEKGVMSKSEAENYMPPVHKPYKSSESEMWAHWRMFAKDSLSKFLADAAQASKKVDESIASITCLTTCPTTDFNSLRGVDFYDDARDMDIVGITHYVGTNGTDFFRADLDINFAESAAANYGKHCWLVEYDARTDIPNRKLNEETYMALGCGIKGIMYYQWRADCPMPTSPEANGFGFLNYDGTEADNFENGMKMVEFLHRMSDKLVCAEKLRTNVGILYSNHAVFMADTAAVKNEETSRNKKQRNSTIQSTLWIYEQLKRNGITADVVVPEVLADNHLHTNLLFIPDYDLLSEEEKEQVKNFQSNGGKVFIKDIFGFRELDVEITKYTFRLSVRDILDECEVTPFVEVIGSPYIMTNVLRGEDYHIVSINNIRTSNQPIDDVTLKLHIPGSEAVLMTPGSDIELKIENGIVHLPNITDGGMLYIK